MKPFTNAYNVFYRNTKTLCDGFIWRLLQTSGEQWQQQLQQWKWLNQRRTIFNCLRFTNKWHFFRIESLLRSVSASPDLKCCLLWPTIEITQYPPEIVNQSLCEQLLRICHLLLKRNPRVNPYPKRNTTDNPTTNGYNLLESNINRANAKQP